MNKNRVRRRMAIVLIAALCLGVCAGEPKSQAAETGQFTEETVKKVLDGNNQDEDGWRYQIDGSAKTAKFVAISADTYKKEKEGSVEIRVPDIVVKEDTEYPVTSVRPQTDHKEGFFGKLRLYIGKNVTDVYFGDVKENMAVYVHDDNPKLMDENGTLFSKDKKTLLRVNDDDYGADVSFVFPDVTEQMESNCFCRAEIGEVILNEKIQRIAHAAFMDSTISKIDLKNVKEIGQYGFAGCTELKEVALRQEGMTIDEYAFFNCTSLEHLYIPANTDFFRNNCELEGCTNLKTVILEEQAALPVLTEAISLKTLILPDGITEIPAKMLDSCVSLRKLCLPETVETIGSNAFWTAGDLSVYAETGSPAESYKDDNVTFISVSEHEHCWEEVTFFAYDTWGVKGKYCRECGCGTDIERVEFTCEADKQTMPDLLVPPEDTCPDVLELDDFCRDSQGLQYEVDEADLTASVVPSSYTPAFPKRIFMVPETVRRDGKVYTVDTLQSSAIGGFSYIIILPDTIKKLNAQCVGYTRKLILNSDVEYIADNAFGRSCYNMEITMRGGNTHYKIVEGGLFTSDMTKLLFYMGNVKIKTYTVPRMVKAIPRNAFYRNETLKKITIYNKADMTIDEDAFLKCYAQIEYRKDSATIETLAPTPTRTVGAYAWSGGETTASLGTDYTDENGFTYTLKPDTKTAELSDIAMSRHIDGREDIVLKIPDNVLADGIEYTVDKICLDEVSWSERSDTQKVRLYIGKYVKEAGLGDFLWDVVSYVHEENTALVSDRGSLFSIDKTKLYRFCDETYERDDAYTLPQGVVYVDTGAFYGAQIGEVYFNDELEVTGNAVFQYSYVKKVDLRHVKAVRKEMFAHCQALEEVIIRDEEASVWEYAFFDTKNLKNIYLPPRSCLYQFAFQRSGLETIVLGEGTTLYEGDTNFFAGAYDLKTVILPDGITKLPKESFAYCFSLEKLYIPESVSAVSKGCFTQSATKLYSEKESLADEIAEETVSFHSLQGHTHKMEEVTFFQYDTWAVTGSYCAECGYATACHMVETEGAELPKKLKYPTKESLKTLTLDESNQDDNGIIYTLYDGTMTAKVSDFNKAERDVWELNVPEKVVKGEKEYTVTVLGKEALNLSNLTVLTLPDTIKRLEKHSIYKYVRIITLGAGVEYIDDEVLCGSSLLDRMDFRETPLYFVYENGVLYNKDKTKLIRFGSTRENVNAEFTIPETVIAICPYAFSSQTWPVLLKQINIWDKAKTAVSETAFVDCDAYVHYMNDSTGENVPADTKTPEETASPQPSETELPQPPPQSPEETVPPADSPSGDREDENDESYENEETPPLKTQTVSRSQYKKSLTITGFHVASDDNRVVAISWKQNQAAQAYHIYRAQKKKGTYRRIAVVQKTKSGYTDKTAKPLQQYYYKMAAAGTFKGKEVKGAMSKRCAIRITGIGAPQIAVRKGQWQSIPYVMVHIKQYQGEYAEIYTSLDGKKFKKIKLVSNRISRYDGKFKLRYMVKNKKIRLKVRIYRKRQGKKICGNFSKVVEISV